MRFPAVNIFALIRPAAVVSVVGLSIAGAAIYRRSAALRDAAGEAQGPRPASEVDAVLDLSTPGVRPSTGRRPRPRIRPSVCVQAADSPSDRERELAKIEQTLEQLTTIIVDEAVVYLAGYIAGRDEGDDASSCPASP